MFAEQFGSLDQLKLTDLPKPSPAPGRALVRMTAAGVTPLDHTILTGGMPTVKPPLAPGNEGAGVIEDAGDTGLRAGTRVMFTGGYGVREPGTYAEWAMVRKEDVVAIPDGITDVAAAGVPVAYLTAYLALKEAGFSEGKAVFAPAVGGSVGNAVTQLARALGARHAVTSSTKPEKAAQARRMGFDEVVDLSQEGLAAGVRRITEGRGVDIVIDAIGGDVLAQGLASLAPGGTLTTLGYSAGRIARIDVTHLIWKRAAIRSFSLFAQSPVAVEEAWQTLLPLLASGAIRPIVAKTFALQEAGEALRYLVEERPFGRVVLTF
jgi:NADPH:quinone reductase-like Zn-dependent oxidoreductase